MNKKHFLFLSLLTLFTSVGCSRISNSSSAHSSSENKTSETTTASEAVHMALRIKSLPSKTSYHLYDKLDFTGLEIYAESVDSSVSSKVDSITDYTLVDTNGNELTNQTVIDSVPIDNSMDVIIQKEGYDSISFNIFVEDVKNYTQSLIVAQKPKTIYNLNETFTSEGMNVNLYTSYVVDKKKNQSTQSISDYTLSIENTETKKTALAENYTFSTAGDYNLIISYQGSRELLKTKVKLHVISDERENNILTLPDYDDDTISFSTISTKMEVSFTKGTNTTSTEDKGYYSPDEVENAYNISTYRTRNVYNWRYLPSTGDVPLLVIPVITPGDESKATSANWSLIYKAFFGNSDELGFESLHSYYYRSSHKQLNLKGGVTGYFDPSEVNSTYSSVSGYNSTTIAALPELAATWAKNTYNLDLTKYDSDKDGYIDGIWLVYLRDYDVYNTNTFWAFTSTTGKANTNINSPTANNYAWASMKFIHGFATSYGDSENSALDAHVLIHETGHMLGLSDYYTYSQSTYSPTGEADMMCKNIGDLNPYSKMMLGWITPYIVYDSTAKIKINSSLEKDNVIVIPYDDKTYQKNADGKVMFNVYDEYLVLDYYSDKDLNSHDYLSYSAYHVQGNGGRLYHVDARLANYTQTGVTFYSDPDDPFTTKKTDTGLIQAISNSESGSNSEQAYFNVTTYNAYDEVRWISRDKRYLSTQKVANSSSLFLAGDTFKISDYSSSFNTSTVSDPKYYLNCKKTFSTQFTIHSIA